MTAIETIIFDIGNVFVRWDPRNLYEKLIPADDDLKRFFDDVPISAWNLEQDRGRTFADGIRILGDQYPQYRDLIEAYDTRWIETIAGQIDGTVELAHTLNKKGYPLYALTNFSQEKWPILCAHYPFTELFKGVVVSGEEGLIKPDPRIFELIFDRFNIDPAKAIFIDDRAENVTASEECGTTGHLFETPAKLADHLRELALL